MIGEALEVNLKGLLILNFLINCAVYNLIKLIINWE